jgi:hypothetical protein
LILFTDTADLQDTSREEKTLPRTTLQKVKRAISEGTIHLKESLIMMTKAEYHHNNTRGALTSGKFRTGLRPNIPLAAFKAAFKPDTALQAK